MKTLKAFTCLILVFALVFAFAACGGNGDRNGPDAGESQADTAENSEAESEETVNADPEQGVIDMENYDYKSESLGLGIRLDESWDIRDADELISMTGASNFSEALQESATIADFYAVNSGNNSNLAIVYENMVRSYGGAFDVDTYISDFKTHLILKLRSQNSDVNEIEEITRTVGGKTKRGYYLEVNSYGIVTYLYMLFKRCGDFMGIITITCKDKAELDRTLAMFYGLD